jgi:hypothetical protein
VCAPSRLELPIIHLRLSFFGSAGTVTGSKFVVEHGRRTLGQAMTAKRGS